MNFAETISRASYGKSSAPAAPENQNDDWKRGYEIGLKKTDPEDAAIGFDHIAAEYLRIGEPHPLPETFLEFKRGYWAGSFARIDRLHETTKP